MARHSYGRIVKGVLVLLLAVAALAAAMDRGPEPGDDQARDCRLPDACSPYEVSLPALQGTVLPWGI